MTNREPQDLMQSAWARRRASFKATPVERKLALTKAREELATAVSLCQEQNSPVHHAHALHLLANVEVDLGHERRALSLWESSVAILREANDVLQLAHKLRHLGDLHRHCGRLDLAESCYAEALLLYREHDEPGSLDFANAVSRMADLKERKGEPSAALELWRETRELYSATNVSSGIEEAQERIDRLSS